MQANLMGDAAASEIEWNESFFRDSFDNVAKVVTCISRKQKPFARFQFIAKQLIAEKKISCGDAILKSVETRFASRHSMTERVMHHKKVYKQFAKDEHFLANGVVSQEAQADPCGGTHPCVYHFVLL